MKENVILDQSFDIALEIIRIDKEMKNQSEFVLSKQLLQSGRSIGPQLLSGRKNCFKNVLKSAQD